MTFDQPSNPNIDTTEEDMAIATDKGAILLDELNPAWFQAIDLDELKMQEYASCIIGQCYPHEGFYAGMRNVGIERLEDSYVYGFDLEDPNNGNDRHWDRLTSLWTEKVTSRLEDWATSRA